MATDPVDPKAGFNRFIEDWTDPEGNKTYEQRLSTVEMEQHYIVNFQDLYTYDLDLAALLLKDATTHLNHFTQVVNTKLNFRGQNRKINTIQIRNLPAYTDIRKIDHNNINRLLMIAGTIVKATDPQQKINTARFKCTACEAETKEKQTHQFITYPQCCTECKSQKWEILPDKSTYTQIQKLTIQEKIEDVSPGNMPRTYEVEVGETLIDTAKPGDRVSVTGYIKGRRKSKNDTSLIMRARYDWEID